MTKFDWQKQGDCSFRCALSNGVTLFAVPENYAKGFIAKPARGTKWRYGASRWDNALRTVTAFGRDTYADAQPTAKDAMRQAETLYLETEGRTNG